MKEQRISKIKIAISVIGHDISKDNGINKRAKGLADLLGRLYDVTLIGRGNKMQKFENTIIITPVNTKLWNFKLIFVIIKNRFDYIYCVGDLFGFFTYYIFSKIYPYKIIFDATGIYSELSISPRLPTKIYKLLEQFVIKHADNVTTIAEYVFNYYKKYNLNINLIPLFVDEDIFKNNKIRCKSEKKETNKLLGMIGPFDLSANRDYINFLNEALDKFDNRIDFLLIGREIETIKSERITYTGYLDSIQDYADKLRSLDAVLSPHKTGDPGPYTKIVESMSCGLPVFTTPEGIVGLDQVSPGKDILVCEKGELIDKVNELIFNNELMDEIGRNARLTVENYYSKEATKEILTKIIECLDANC